MASTFRDQISNSDYSDRYIDIISKVLKHEGGFVNHSNDPGGATQWGVSLRWLQSKSDSSLIDADLDDDGDIDVQDVREVDPEDAAKFYFKNWWKRHNYMDYRPPIGEKLFDMAINMGSQQAHELLQRALNNIGEDLVVDGIIEGPNTQESLTRHDAQQIVDALCDTQLDFYQSLVEQDDKYAAFIEGWTKRAEAFRSEPFA